VSRRDDASSAGAVVYAVTRHGLDEAHRKPPAEPKPPRTPEP
jgi:hypothetical protein